VAKAVKSSARKTGTAKGGATKRGSSKRELIDTGTAKTFAKRRADGTFKEQDEVGRSLSADRRQRAKTKTRPGFGDRGDRKR